MSIDEQPDYLVRRDGAFFRERAHGYTYEISDAGRFTLDEAKIFLAAEGVTIHAISEYAGRIDGDVIKLERRLSRLKAMQADLLRGPGADARGTKSGPVHAPDAGDPEPEPPAMR